MACNGLVLQRTRTRLLPSRGDSNPIPVTTNTNARVTDSLVGNEPVPPSWLSEIGYLHLTVVVAEASADHIVDDAHSTSCA
eukprot:1071950-Amphidinium_carterae.1